MALGGHHSAPWVTPANHDFGATAWVRDNARVPVLGVPPTIDDLGIAGAFDEPLVPPAPRPARITISRQSPDDVGFREIYVLLDDKEIALLPFGAVVTREVDAWPHRLRAHNTLFRKTHDILLAPGDHLHFIAINRPGWGTFALLGVLGASPLYLTFERRVAP